MAVAERRYRGAWHNRVLFFCALGFILVGASMALASGEVSPGGRILGLLLVAFWLPLAIRILRAGVLPTEKGVIIRGGFRTRRLGWKEIRQFGRAPGDALVPSEMLTVELRDGRTLRLGEVSNLALSRRSPSYVERAAAELNRELSRHSS